MTSLAPTLPPLTHADGLRFREVQRNPRVWIAIAAITLGLVVPGVWRLVRDFPTERSIWDVVQLVLYGAVLLLCNRWKLITEVREDVLWMRHTFARKQSVPLSSIRSAEVVTYYPAIDGEWGVRRGQALRIRLSAGDFFLLGTRRPDELRRLLVGGRSSNAE